MAGTFSSEQTGLSFSLAADMGSVITGSVDEIEKTLAGGITSLLEGFPGAAPLFVFNLPRFVTTRSGGYFFVPSLTSLRSLAGV
jgi:hypothetical protein